MVISKKKHGIPINKSIMAYGIKNAPPPCLKHKYGNLQTFPKPENVENEYYYVFILISKNYLGFLIQNSRIYTKTYYKVKFQHNFCYFLIAINSLAKSNPGLFF